MGVEGRLICLLGWGLEGDSDLFIGGGDWRETDLGFDQWGLRVTQQVHQCVNTVPLVVADGTCGIK